MNMVCSVFVPLVAVLLPPLEPVGFKVPVLRSVVITDFLPVVVGVGVGSGLLDSVGRHG